MLTAARRAARSLKLPRPTVLYVATDTADVVRYIEAAASRWRFDVRFDRDASRFEVIVNLTLFKSIIFFQKKNNLEIGWKSFTK